MVAKGKYKKAVCFPKLFLPKATNCVQKMTGIPACCILLGLPIRFRRTVALWSKTCLQFTAAGTATDLNSIP